MSTPAYPPVHGRSMLVTAAMVAAVLCCQSGCVASKYKLAKKNTPPLQVLSVAFPPSAPLQATLGALIIYGGPGSWKREALWDEYVLAVQNSGDRPVTIDFATLTDSNDVFVAAGVDPWALEKQSKILEKQYRANGVAFARTAAPGVLIVGVGAAALAATTTTVFVSAAAVGAALSAVFVLPVYYVSVWGINHHNKKAVMAEFTRRRLHLPLTLAPGQTLTGNGQATLPLDFLHGLHVPAVQPDAATRKDAKPGN